nr:glycosyltransferase family 2 protein [Neobacillus sp. Marseille-Q6967]
MKKLKPLLIIAAFIFIWIYIGWRTFFTLPSGIGLIPGILLLGSEIILALQSTIFYFLIIKPNNRKPPVSMTKLDYSVDIFVATYNEPIDIIRRTVIACKNLNYNKEQLSIWVCDDGRRKVVKEMADSLGVGYIIRENNKDAKAGNLNNALSQTKADLIVTIDADMVLKPNFLLNTIGYFFDEKVAFVQTPQSFFNEDIYQYNLMLNKRIPNEQDFFMRLIQPGRDRFNAAIYIGSNTIFKRSALEAIGGFATGTITEDLATGMLIQAKGYTTVYHNEVLAQGLAAESLTDFISQRKRWARGTIQTIRKWNPLTLKGLTPIQRLLYVSSLIYWYFGIFRLIFILAPIFYLITGIPSLHASIQGILIFWLPYFLLTGVVEKTHFDKKAKRFWSNIYETSVAPFLALAVIVETLTRGNVVFKVTPKGVISSKAIVNVPFIIPQLVLLGLSMIGIIMGVMDITRESNTGVLINMIWLIYNLATIIPVVLLGRERPKLRKAERFKRNYDVKLTNDSGGKSIFLSTIDISETGCSLFLNRLQSLSKKVELEIYGEYATYRLKGSIVHYDVYQKGYQAGIHLDAMEEAVYQSWIKEVYGVNPDESMFQFKPKTDLLNLLNQYYRAARLPYKKKERTSPRLKANLNCQISAVPYDSLLAMNEMAAGMEGVDIPFSVDYCGTNAIMSDIGLNGCKINIFGTSYNLGETIIVRLPGDPNHYFGEVVRVVNRKHQIELGVKWLEKKGGQEIIEIITG